MIKSRRDTRKSLSRFFYLLIKIQYKKLRMRMNPLSMIRAMFSKLWTTEALQLAKLSMRISNRSSKWSSNKTIQPN
jgi:hypothetical protein